MTLFSLIDKTQVHLAPGLKVIKRDDFQKIQDIEQITQKAIAETLVYKKEAVTEVEKAKAVAEEAGYKEGLERWAKELGSIESEIAKIRQEYAQTILSTAVLVAQKFVGREIKLDPQTQVEIVKTSLKAVNQHKRISIYCSSKDFELLDKARPELKLIFEELDLLGVYTKENLEAGCYIIETERGIINNSNIDTVWQTLQSAFEQALKKVPATIAKAETATPAHADPQATPQADPQASAPQVSVPQETSSQPSNPTSSANKE